MPTEEKADQRQLPPFHLSEAYPDAGSIFTLSLPSLEEIRDDALILLDTNVLLIPYTINPKSLDDIRRTYARLINDGRLFIPAQVARELLEPLPEYDQILQLEKEIDEKLRQYRGLIGDILNHIRTWRWNDSVSTLYRELFKASVIVDSPLSQEETQNDLERRILNRIPPGFSDSSKDDQGIGDLIIWQTILHLGSERKRNIIFVSGDEKSDWWHRSEGEALYPRFELVDEYMRASDNSAFHIAKFSQLLDLFGAEQQVVAEVRQEELVRRPVPSPVDHMQFYGLAEDAVYARLRNRFSETALQIVRRGRTGFPDFIITLDNAKRLGVDVKAFRRGHPALIAQRIREFAYRGYYEVSEGDLDGLAFALVIQDETIARETIDRAARALSNIPNVGLVIGTMDSSGSFSPVLENLSELL